MRNLILVASFLFLVSCGKGEVGSDLSIIAQMIIDTPKDIGQEFLNIDEDVSQENKDKIAELEDTINQIYIDLSIEFDNTRTLIEDLQLENGTIMSYVRSLESDLLAEIDSIQGSSHRHRRIRRLRRKVRELYTLVNQLRIDLDNTDTSNNNTVSICGESYQVLGNGTIKRNGQLFSVGYHNYGNISFRLNNDGSITNKTCNN